MKPSFTPTVRKVLAGIAVVSTLASVVVGREAPSVVAPATPKVDARLQVRDDIDLGKLESRRGADSKTDPFAPRNFGPAAAAPQSPAPSARNEAPVLPFRYIGKMIDNGQLAVFLQKGDESFSVMAGERVGDYRVDSISENEIRFTYLPMKTKQTLPL
jgi:hypothetical protein